MPSLSVALINGADIGNDALVDFLAACPAVSKIIVARQSKDPSPRDGIKTVPLDPLSTPGLIALFEAVSTDYLMLISPGGEVAFSTKEAVERFISVAADTGAALIYSDFKEWTGDRLIDHPTIDYQLGSIRDNFDFGPVMVISIEQTGEALFSLERIDPALKWGALYDLRLRLSRLSYVIRIPEPLYSRKLLDTRSSGERLFDYVDPAQRAYQVEMEEVATGHLERLDMLLSTELNRAPKPAGAFPVRATVVIPVRNRERTIADAITSALSQQTSFDYNIIVVDNHSTDRTGEVVGALALEHPRVIHLIPGPRDLGIGGCWNQAIYSEHCGRYAVQLDSDDLYQDEHSLQEIVSKLEGGRYAMVVGSYTIVDFNLNPLPPGLIDHREWTQNNGRNNALRINGLGAPRAFDVSILRTIGFPNTSYGEDYRVGLRISREYEIGRIFESVYLARRWEGNSDAQLDIATANRYDQYKDRLRSIEMLARKQMMPPTPDEDIF